MPVSEPMSKLSSHCRMIGSVRSIFSVATALPSTLSMPVPPRPMPLKLLNASVPGAESVVLEVELHRVLAGREGLGAFPADALEVDQVPEEHRLALEQVEAVAAEAPAGGEDHALGAALRHVDVGRDRVGAVQQQRASRLAACPSWAGYRRTRCGRP